MSKRTLVIGGGLSGIKAALNLGQIGIETILVERTEKLGGTFEKLGSTFPYGDDARTYLNKYLQTLQSLQNVKIFTKTQVKSVTKVEDGFEVFLEPNGTLFKVGAIIVAIGYTPFDGSRIPNYGQGKFQNVIDSLELVQMLRNGQNLKRPSDQTLPKRVTFITCVGSRDKKTNEYCSSFCCTYTVHLAKMVKEINKKIDVTIMYMDIRTFSSYESLYQAAREIGVKFLRGKPSIVFEEPDTHNVKIQVENTITQEFVLHETDIAVLSIGAEATEGSYELGKILGIAKDEKTGFFAVSREDDVSALGQERIFIAGNASGPKDTQYSLAQASAAAMKAFIAIGGVNSLK
ncbi:MAG: FAD-dependent oxidoreductase [Candidatus Hodarchaeota archaeon]